MSNVFAAPPIKYFSLFFRLSIPNPNPNLKLGLLTVNRLTGP